MKRSFVESATLTSVLGGIAIASLMACGAANAADLPPAHKAPPALPEVYSWTGFYVGAHLGAGWARNGWTDVNESCLGPACRPQYLGQTNATGLLGGFQAGYNWQVNPWLVFGIEGQYSFANLKGDHSDAFSVPTGHKQCDGDICTGNADFKHFEQNDRFFTNVKDIAAIAGRIGIVSGPSDRTMWYVKGGAAYARDNFASKTTTGTLTCNFANNGFSTCSDTNSTSSLSASQSRWGWVVGTGLEFGLWGNWSAKVEYDFLDLGDKTVSLTGTTCSFSVGPGISKCGDDSRNVKIDQTMHIVKFGVNYRFGGNSTRY